MVNAAIVGTGWYVPEEIITNSFFNDGEPWFFYDGEGNRIPDALSPTGYLQTLLTDEKMRQISGVEQRHKAAAGERVHHLVEKAARRALADAGMEPRDLDGIIVATVTPHRRFSSAANCVQELLGAQNVHACYDIANACAGFPLAVDIAAQKVRSEGKVYLVAGAEVLTRIVDYAGRDVNANLFGDGAGAAILAPTERDIGVLAYAGRSSPEDGKIRYIVQDDRGFVRMPEGPRVFVNAVQSMHAVTLELLEKTGWRKDEVDYFVYHQANIRILDRLMRVADIDPARVGKNIAQYGNMSAATNPVLLAQAREYGAITDGSKVIIAAFGAGLVTAGVAVRF
jgi:3-oxoacyl-[acyl-carrier-protein] synthase-3